MKPSNSENAWGLDVAARGGEEKQEEKPPLLSNSPSKTTQNLREVRDLGREGSLLNLLSWADEQAESSTVTTQPFPKTLHKHITDPFL